MTALELTLAGVAALASVSVAAWVRRRDAKAYRDVSLEERLAAVQLRDPSPVRVTIVRRPSAAGFLVITDNPTRVGTSAAGHPIPRNTRNYGPFRTLKGAQRRAESLRRSYALLQLPDVEVVPAEPALCEVCQASPARQPYGSACGPGCAQVMGR